MAFIDWTPQLSVGIPSIDAQHLKLVELVNKLYEAMGAGKGNDVMRSVLDDLILYTKRHFKDEEALLQKHGYPDTQEHKARHDALLSKVNELHARCVAGERVSPVTTGTFLKTWLSEHIRCSDKAYAAQLIAAGVR